VHRARIIMHCRDEQGRSFWVGSNTTVVLQLRYQFSESTIVGCGTVCAPPKSFCGCMIYWWLQTKMSLPWNAGAILLLCKARSTLSLSDGYNWMNLELKAAQASVPKFAQGSAEVHGCCWHATVSFVLTPTIQANLK